MPPRRSAILAASLTALAALAAAGLYWRATARGVGLYGDSVDYVAAARSVLAGDGVKTLDGQGGVYPMTQFPPGYPLLLAGAALVSRLDPVDAARPLNGLLGVGTVLLAGWGAWRPTRSAPAAALAAALVATAVPLLSMTARLYSEAAFLFLSLLALLLVARAIDAGRWRWVVAAGLAAGAAAVVRYAGFAVIGVGAAALATLRVPRVGYAQPVPRDLPRTEDTGWGYPTRGTRRFFAAGLFLAIALLPGVVWAARNVAVAGRPTSRLLRFHPPTLGRLADGGWTLLAWVSPDSWAEAGVAGVVGLCVVTGLTLHHRQSRLCEAGEPPATPQPAGATRVVLLAWLVGYPLFLLASLTFFDANVPLNDRILCPLYAPGAALLAVFAFRLAPPAKETHRLAAPLAGRLMGEPRAPQAGRLNGGVIGRGRVPAILALVLSALVAGLLTLNLLGAWHWSAATHDRGLGYARPRWQRSQTVRALSALPPDFCVYTDGYDAVYLLTGRRVRQLPKTGHRSAGEANPRYDAEVAAMADRLRETGGWIVLFDHIDRDDFLMTEADLRQRFELVDARRKQPSDGRIYRIVPKSAPK